jgi:hypothetical protein
MEPVTTRLSTNPEVKGVIGLKIDWAKVACVVDNGINALGLKAKDFLLEEWVVYCKAVGRGDQY